MMLSLKAAAAELGVSVSSVKRILARHEMEYLKIGRRTLIESSEVERYIDSLRGGK
jgi:excisionase family DNA binding protein